MGPAIAGAVGALVLVLVAVFVPAARLAVGLTLMIAGFIGTISVMAMFVGLPIMLVGLVIVLLDVHARRSRRADQHTGGWGG